MMRLLSEMMKLPLNAFVYSVEMFVKTIQGLQRIADRSIEILAVGSDAPEISREADRPSESNGSDVAVSTNSNRRSETMIYKTDALDESAKSISKERRIMDRDLHDDMLKLVRYKVLYVKREYEHAFPEREDLVSENMDGSAFSAWKTAEFIQELAGGATQNPLKWSDKEYPPDEFRRDGRLIGLPDEDKKYLRVYYEVLERYPREKFKYEEQQIRVLEQIRDKMPVK